MRESAALLLLVAVSTVIHADDPESKMVEAVQQAIVDQTNDYREKHGLSPVGSNDDLVATASKFATFMAESGKYGHHADGRTPAERAKDAGYQYCVVRENIAYRTNTGEVTEESLTEVFVQGWIESPPHRENILADFVTETGVSVATTDGVTYYAVQLFGRPKSAAIQVKVTNLTKQNQTLVVTSNDSEDEVELPSRSIITMKRCFPATLSLTGSDSKIEVKDSIELSISDDGLSR
ncbi:CAP domain-containing protein [Planctomycetes bacterium TBK1r]|uniref:Cysteine-rich secretory protein family protein n=1 Tax=Stieleria magnilauensis TaxID=2527963 RepID=A0ABX5XXQ7_9BACT|nr:Cysteine-rich secretory protein family protein [Planctomycetes bacterium TBK1r]